MRKMVELIRNNLGRIVTTFVMVMFAAVPVFAVDKLPLNAEPFEAIMRFMAQWTVYLGISMAFFGAIQLAMGFRTDDSEGKNKGMRSMMAGLIVCSVALCINEFMGMARDAAEQIEMVGPVA